MLIETRASHEGSVDREGVRVAYQVFGGGPPALLLLPTWPIVHSDFWRLQVPHLAARYTVVTFDGRGNGASGRPIDAASYSTRTSVDDALAVMDATGLDRAAVLSVSLGAEWAAALAAEHPERVAASIFIAPYLALGPQTDEREAAAAAFDELRSSEEGWAKWNRHYWHQDWPGFLEFFFSQCFTEPDSRAFIDHFVAMGLQTTPTVIATTEDADQLEGDPLRAVLGRIRCPTMVIHGTDDAIAPVEWGTMAASILGSELHVLKGAGHEPELREADVTNARIDAFLDRHWPQSRRHRSEGALGERLCPAGSKRIDAWCRCRRLCYPAGAFIAAFSRSA
jgi:pimeloyl-ACP methyl ester carboxylesterase